MTGLSGRAPIVIAVLAALAATPAAGAETALDYAAFKSRVEPIFLLKRPGHTRCVVCHAGSNNAFRLEPLAQGARAWTEEQSRRNFEVVSKLVNPGKAATSRLLMHPLAPEGGGDPFHSGGRQFMSTDDAAYQILARWIDGKK